MQDNLNTCPEGQLHDNNSQARISWDDHLNQLLYTSTSLATKREKKKKKKKNKKKKIIYKK